MTKKVYAFLEEKCEQLGIVPETIMDISNTLPNGYDILDMDKGSKIVADVINNGTGLIVANCDSDQDGMISGAVNIYALQQMGVPPERIYHLQNSRKYGNGYNDKAVSLIKSLGVGKVDLIITSDHGSWDEVRYKETKEFDPDIKIVVTDHHLVPKEEPKSIDCFINPQRIGSDPIFRNLSGAVTTMYLMIATSFLLSGNDDITEDPFDMMNVLLPMGAITTLCDQMSMIDPFNRTIVTMGLKLMNSGVDHRWKALKTFYRLQEITDTNLMMKLGPAINSCGRMDFTSIPVLYFLSKTRPEAMQVLTRLDQINKDRRKRQDVALDYVLGYDDYINFSKEHNHSLVVIHDEEISGLTGPLASAIGNNLKVPITILSTNVSKPDSYTGSCRSIRGINIKSILDQIDESDKDIFVKYGGHAGAAGIEINSSKVQEFKEKFEYYISNTTTGSSIDYEIDFDFGEFSMEDFESVRQLAPFGNNWKEPDVSIEVEIEKVFPIKKQHVSYSLNTGKCLVDAFDFQGYNRMTKTPYKVTFKGPLSGKRVGGKTLASMFVREIIGE